MRANPLLTLSVLAVLGSGSARGESLQCAIGSVAEGDSRLAVLYKCGEPLARDGACAPVHYVGSLRRVPQPFASSFVPCVPTEEWLYERGPGNLVAMVRFRSGKVQSIQYGHVPR
jgi:hypothetical protein